MSGSLAQEFTERWVHQQQMREAVGRAEDHETTVPEVLNTFVWAYPHQLPASDGLWPVEVLIEDISVWTLTATADGAWSLSTGLSGEADTRLRLSADTAWRLLTRG